MHFRQALRTVTQRDLIDPFQNAINVRLNQKTAGADALGGITKGVQSQQLYPPRGQEADVFFHQRIGQRRLVIKVDLPFGKGTPNPPAAAVGKGHVAKRLLLLADMDFGEIIRCNLAEALNVHKKLGMQRVIAFIEKVEKLNRLVRDMVDRQIATQIIVSGQSLNIPPVAELRVHFLVRQG